MSMLGNIRWASSWSRKFTCRPMSEPSLAHQPTDASPYASASITSVCSIEVIPGPPQSVLKPIRKTPASRSSCTTSSGRLRFRSISAARRRSTGASARALARISAPVIGTSVRVGSVMVMR